MKKLYLFFLLAYSYGLLQAQTWTGASNTDWNTPSNWNPAGVPTTAANIVIPGALTNYPLFAGKVIINSIDMKEGSLLDFNGYPLTINGNNYNINFNGATLNNSNGTTDIVININTGIGGFYTFFSSNTVNDHIVFNITGQNQFVEGYTAPYNHYTGNASFNINDVMPVLLSYLSASKYDGDLTLNRTVTGASSLFNAGATISGNFTFANTVGSSTGIGNPSSITTIGGMVNITAGYTTPGTFVMQRLANFTSGGNIDIQNSQGFYIQNNSLLFNALRITGYRGDNYADLHSNSFTGNVSIGNDASYGGGFATRIRNNIITGNCIFTNDGSNVFLEADGSGTGNKYVGDVTFNAAGGSIYIAYNDSIHCTGNLTINRSSAGFTQAFRSGGTIGGNFTFINNSSGNSTLGNPLAKTSIGGTVNISAHYTVTSVFEMYWLVNQTTGGRIEVQNSQGFNVQKNTLLIDSLNITGYRGDNYADLHSNNFTGNVSIANDAGYGGSFSTRIRNNVVTGNCNFTHNGSNVFIDADAVGTANKYFGNVTFNVSGGPLYIAYNDSIYCSGNTTINRTEAGHTQAFRGGGFIGGDFFYTNNSAGNTFFGSINAPTNIGGSINITTHHTTPGIFEMIRLSNKTGGGGISVQNSFGYNLSSNTLIVNEVSLTGYSGATNTFFAGNTLKGNFTTADDAGYTGGFYTYIRSNSITGNSNITINGSNALLDADLGSSANKYMGNVSYTRTAGSINIGNGDVNEYHQNLTFNADAGIVTGKIKFSGNTNGIVAHAGAQPVSIAELIMEKSGTATITLSDTFTISNSLTFINGIINSSAGNELIFADNSTYTGGSDGSFVNGPVIKTGNDAFIFPVGKVNKIAPIGIGAPANATDEFWAEYFMNNPAGSGYDITQKDAGINNVSSKEYWLLNRVNGTSNVLVSLSWENSRSGLVNNITDLRIARWSGSSWQDEGNGTTTGSNAAGTVVSAGAVSNFSPFTLASATAFNPLPVHLVHFSAIKNSSNVLLQWTAENEHNFYQYQVEKSGDASSFTCINTVLAKGTFFKTFYEVTDINPISGINYYRLKMLDKDGGFTYSEIVKIAYQTNIGISILPNPTKGYIMLKSALDFKQIQIFDITGKLLRQMNKTANNHYNIAGLTSGIYFIRLTAKTSTATIKFLVE